MVYMSKLLCLGLLQSSLRTKDTLGMSLLSFARRLSLSLSLNRYVSTLSLIFCKAKFRCSVDGQVSLPFPSEITGDDRDVSAAATACIDSTIAKMRRKIAIIVDVTVHVATCFEPWGRTYDL